MFNFHKAIWSSDLLNKFSTWQFLVSGDYNHFVWPFIWKVHISQHTSECHDMVVSDTCMGAHFVVEVDAQTF